MTDLPVYYILTGVHTLADVGVQGTQVLSRIELLHSVRDVRLVAFMGKRLSANAAADVSRSQVSLPVPLHIITLDGSRLSRVREAAAWLTRHLRETSPQAVGVILHCRSNLAANIGRLVRRELGDGIHIIYDMEGAEAHERLYAGMSRGLLPLPAAVAKYLLVSRWEARGLRAADRVICVSENMRAYIRDRYHVPLSRSVCVPSTADERLFHFSSAERAAVRGELGFADESVLVYSGSLAPYQRLDLQARLVCECLQANPRTRLLVISLQRDTAARAFSAHGVPETAITAASAHYTDVRAYLNAADLGLCLRDQSLVNCVASPTKVAEYLLCGLPVAVSKWTGDYPSYVEAHRAGVVLKDFTSSGFESAAANVAEQSFSWNANRLSLARQAQATLSHQAVLPIYAQLYESVTAEAGGTGH